MSEIIPDKIHVNLLSPIKKQKLSIPRRYTLTHSDFTGDLFLTINREYDKEKISDFYTKLMRDEVLAEWKKKMKIMNYIYIFI